MFDVVIVGAGKPTFYTGDRPFRQISPVTGKIQWTQVQIDVYAKNIGIHVSSNTNRQ